MGVAGQRRRGPRGDLSAELIVEAAERVLDEGGLDRLSLRRIAAAAGIAPNAVYTYFPDMDGLRNQIGDRFLATLDLSLLDGAADVASLTAFLHAVLLRFRTQPARVQILATQRVIGPHALALNEALLGFFDAAGLCQQRAWTVTSFLTEWLHGAAALAPSQAPTPAFLARLAAIDLDDYPRTAAMLHAPTPAEDLELIARALLAPEAPVITGQNEKP